MMWKPAQTNHHPEKTYLNLAMDKGGLAKRIDL